MCPECGKPWEINPISGDLTCFIHGRKDGSLFEQVIWKQAQLTKGK
jgi:hypothetical protein